MLRLKDIKSEIDILRFSESVSIETIRQCPLVYGLPTMYLPNRLHQGVLKTSEKTYNLPINEPDFNNFIHGFLHLREYKVIKTESYENVSLISAEYIYAENDEFFKFLPLKFKAVITYTLSEKGLEQNFSITNLSESVLPVSVGSHTAINCLFLKNVNENDLKISINVDKKIPLNDNCVCKGDLADLSDYDLKYKNATMNPLTTEIDNDMYVVNPTDTDGNDFYGIKIFDEKTGQTICYETGKEYKFWLVWNEWARNGYCCPEPMSAMINAPNISLEPETTGYLELKTGESWSGYQHLYLAQK